MNNRIKHAFSMFSMVGGTAAVFTTVMVMNAYEEPPKEQPKEAGVEFEVEKKPPPKKERPKPEPKARPKRSNEQAPTPTPNLSEGVSAPALALPGFSISELGSNLSEKLLGDTEKKMTAMAGAACDTPPKPVRRAKPEFPADARKAGIGGKVKLSVRIATDGHVDTIKLVEASPPGVFDDVAKQAMQDWEFSPCIYQNEPVVGWVTQTMVFELGSKT